MVITGDIAAGKSTFAEMLSHRYSVSAFTKDRLKEVLCETIGFADRAENKKLSNAAVSLLQFIFAECTKSGNNLILEANFSDSDMKLLRELADRNNYDMLTLVLEGNAETLYERYMHRMRYEGRHHVHLTSGAENFETFKDFIEYGRSQQPTGKSLKINADDFLYQSDKHVLKQIDGFMQN